MEVGTSTAGGGDHVRIIEENADKPGEDDRNAGGNSGMTVQPEKAVWSEEEMKETGRQHSLLENTPKPGTKGIGFVPGFIILFIRSSKPEANYHNIIIANL